MQPARSKGAFERAAKRCQADFRDMSPTISDAGRSPTDAKGQRNRHLLAQGCEIGSLYPGIRGEGDAVAFFRDRGIQWWKNARSGDDKDIGSPTRNMASSQIACVNFLLPLARIPGALTAALRAIDGDVVEIVDKSRTNGPLLSWSSSGSAWVARWRALTPEAPTARVSMHS